MVEGVAAVVVVDAPGTTAGAAVVTVPATVGVAALPAASPVVVV
jgi:hypothetical protein